MEYLSSDDINEFFKHSTSHIVKFKCMNCRSQVDMSAPGTHHRNHCPYCLYSIHLDVNVGDRMSRCNGMMLPIGRFKRRNGEDILVHRCRKCNKICNNRVAGDDNYKLMRSLKIYKVNCAK